VHIHPVVVEVDMVDEEESTTLVMRLLKGPNVARGGE
jgi:hypothetical protein